MDPQTHLRIDPTLVGRPVRLAEGYAEVALETTDRMRADAEGLVHGGFVFGLADYAAMLAVNHPHVVLGSSESRFLRPVRVGQALVAVAELGETRGKKRFVHVGVRRGEEVVFEGTFTCFVLPAHVLG